MLLYKTIEKLTFYYYRTIQYKLYTYIYAVALFFFLQTKKNHTFIGIYSTQNILLREN